MVVSPSSTPSPVGFGAFLARWAFLAGILLGLNVVGILVSLYCALFGPARGMVFGIIGFLFGWCGIVFFLMIQDQKNRQVAWPGLVEPFPWLALWRVPVAALTGLAALALIISLFVLLTSSGSAGVAQLPVMQERAVYHLNNHGRYTEVSRTRFILVGASFCVGWHSGTLLMSLVPLSYLLFGTRFGKEE